MSARGLCIDLRMDMSLLLVSVTRRFVEAVLEKRLGNADLVSRAAMSAHELLENAAKYSRDGKAHLTIGIDEGPPGGGLRLTVGLRNSTSSAHIDRLKEIFTELDGAADPLALYIELMRRNARAKDISGIGLARIRAEGEMALSLAVEAGIVTIMARTPVLEGDLS